jgi:hypothetical protein
MPINSTVFPALSCTSSKVSGLILRFLIHFELIIVQGERHGYSFSFLHTDPFFPETFVQVSLVSPSYVLGAFVKNQVE